MIKGKDIRVYIGGNVIGAARSCTISTTTDTLESSSPDSARARAYTPGRTGWEIQVSKLVTNMKADLLRNGQTVSISVAVNNTDRLSGTAICTNVQMSGEVGKLAQCSCKFLGSGELS